MAENAWLFVADRDNWVDCEASKSFGLKTKPGRIKPAKPGDPLVAYVTKESVFAGIGTITSSYYYEETAVWKADTYPHRVGIDTKLDFDNAVDVRTLVDSLDFITDKVNWQVFFYGGAFKIPMSDFEMIRGAIERQKLKTKTTGKVERKAEEKPDISQIIMSLPELTATSLHDRIAEMIYIVGLRMGYDAVQRYRTRSDSPYQIDVVWLQNKNPQIAVEVHHGGQLGDALHRLKHARDFNFRKVILIIVDPSEHKRALDILKFDDQLKHVIDLWSTNSVYNMYATCESFHELYGKFERSLYKEEPDTDLL